jgi:hypothetical protein
VRGIAFSPVNRNMVTSAGIDKAIAFYDISERKSIG